MLMYTEIAVVKICYTTYFMYHFASFERLA